MFTYSHANTPLRQSERAYYLSYFINLNSAREIKFHRCLFMLSIKLDIRIFTSKSRKNAEEMFYKVWFTCKVIVLPIRPGFLFCFVFLFFWKFSLSQRRWIFKFLMFPSNTGSDVIWRLDVGVKWTILGDPGAVSRVGRKGATKVFKHRRKSPWVPTLTGPFPNGQANAGSWLGTKNALYYYAQSANSISWVLFVSSYTTAIDSITAFLAHAPNSPVNLGIFEAQHQTNCNRNVFNVI